MEALTPAERRGALVVVLLLALGAGHDLWRAVGSPPAPGPGATSSALSPLRPEARPADAGGPEPLGSRPGLPPEAVRVDLNRASAQELEALPGIGPVLAARIVSQRERHGPFRSSEELLAVRGIGPRLFARLRPHLVVDASRMSPATAPGDSAPRGD